MRGAAQAEGATPDTVQSLQHEIEVIKAKIAQDREKIRVSGLGLVKYELRLTEMFAGQNSPAGG